MSNIKLGASLFCYGCEYARYQYDFEECVKQAAAAGATGYEIVASQMIPSYPNISDDFLKMVEELKEKYGIGPVGYGANNDKGIVWDHVLTDDEMLAATIIDLKAANKLGCKVMRSQYMMSPEAFERLAPYAQMYDVKVGIEVHNPDTPKSERMLKYLEAIQRSGSKYLGFVLDLGCFAIAPNKPMWDEALALGVKEEHLELAADCRRKGLPVQEAQRLLDEAGASPAIGRALQGMYGFVQFRPETELPRLFEEAKEMMPYTFEIHGKFHYLDDACVEASIPYEQILNMLKETEFDGYIISEYEDELHVGGYEFTRRHLEMERRILGL